MILDGPTLDVFQVPRLTFCEILELDGKQHYFLQDLYLQLLLLLLLLLLLYIYSDQPELFPFLSVVVFPIYNAESN